jgi:signal transduction histidine kinase
VVAILATRLLMHALAPFLFPSLLAIVLVALVALIWGAGPSLLATLVGVVLLHVLVMPPLLDLAGKRPGQPVAGLLFVAAGIVISIAVSQTERARRDAQALAGRLDAVIEAVTDGVVVYDRDGQVEHLNAPLRRLVALDQWPESVPPSLRELAALLTVRDSQGRPLPPKHGPAQRVLQGETLIGAAALDVQLRALDGQDLEVSVSGAPIRDHQGRLLGGVLTVHDQTERRRLERRAREALAARDRARADVIATVSHDLQQPLTAIRAGLGLLESSARDRLTCDEQGLLESARRNGERLRLQVDDLLAANQIEAGTLRLDCALLDLRHVVTQALGVMQPLFHEKGQALELDLPAPLPIRGDARRLEQVVINLLANAQRHTPPGTRITVAGCAGTQEVHLVVRDTGPGIPPDELEAIFDRFHHLGHGSAGSGLGLTIVRAIVGLHAGRVWAENSEGGGAAFHVVLPHGKGQGAVQSAHCRG